VSNNSTDVRGEYFDGVISRDFYDTICTKRIGYGVTRQVFEANPLLMPNKVVKIEVGTGHFQNQLEWIMWERWKSDKKVSKWLIPCVSISPSGIVLIQERGRPMEDNERPKKIPAWAADTKPENWSIYEGRPVMHDYGHIASQIRHVMEEAVWL